MKSRNRFYSGGPPLDQPDEDLLIRCANCKTNRLSAEWRANRGKCPACGKPYDGPRNED